MKKKLFVAVLTAMITVSAWGCVTNNTEEQPFSSKPESGMEQTAISEQSASDEAGKELEQDDTAVENEVEESNNLTFDAFSTRQFEFSSGAGAWSENFTIEKDGYFTGHFHDSDMGSTGEGYSDGTVYSATYSGHFTDLVKIDEYTYQMRLEEITYDETPDTEEISDNIRYIYTESYCLGGTDTFTIYLPGTPVESLSEEIWSWIFYLYEDETELTALTIADETNGYGMPSFERMAPLEDAQMTLNNYKESYEYYSEKLSSAETTMDMVNYTGTMCELSDDCLNYIWNLIRYNVAKEEFDAILNEQRAWITEKETKAQEAANEYEGGTIATVNYNSVLADMTMTRCEELVEYLK